MEICDDKIKLSHILLFIHVQSVLLINKTLFVGHDKFKYINNIFLDMVDWWVGRWRSSLCKQNIFWQIMIQSSQGVNSNHFKLISTALIRMQIDACRLGCLIFRKVLFAPMTRYCWSAMDFMTVMIHKIHLWLLLSIYLDNNDHINIGNCTDTNHSSLSFCTSSVHTAPYTCFV